MQETKKYFIASEVVTLKDGGDENGLQFSILSTNLMLGEVILRKLEQRGQVYFSGSRGIYVNNNENYIRKPNDSDDARRMVTIEDAREVLQELQEDKDIAAQLRDARAQDAKRKGATNYR